MNIRQNPVTRSGFLELAQAGIENATKAVEMLVPGKLMMDVLWAGSVPTPRLSELSGHPEELVTGAYVRVTGDAPGHALLIFPQRSCMVIADLVFGQPIGTAVEIGTMEMSLIQELANIMTSSYLTAIGDYYQITLLPDPPLMAMDMAAAVIDNVLISSGQFEPETLSIVTRFRSDTAVIDGFFLYIPEAIPALETEAA
jgi:chemotaxis protein CheC